LSFRDKAIQLFIDRSYVAIWDWVQRFDPKRIYQFKNKKRIAALLIDETQIQIGSAEAWLWVAIELPIGEFLVFYISRHKNMLVAAYLLDCMVSIQYIQMEYLISSSMC
jgi:transposase-like protein